MMNSGLQSLYYLSRNQQCILPHYSQSVAIMIGSNHLSNQLIDRIIREIITTFNPDPDDRL
jgi:hypothetical protein